MRSPRNQKILIAGKCKYNGSSLQTKTRRIAEIVWLTTKDMGDISPVDQIIFQSLKDKGLIE